MIPVSVMVTGKATVSRTIKGEYGKGKPSRFTEVLRPIVFWNMTYQCNLHCLHCYIKAMGEQAPGELTTAEAQHLLKQMAAMKIPLVLFSGGEPLVRKDFWEIVGVVKGSHWPKLALSTNGTLIDENTALKLKEHGFVYIGVSIDSIRPEWHDKFRGVKGSFEAAVRGIENSVSVGLKVGIRTTLTRYNIEEVPDILAWCVENRVERVSLYLLDTVGRGEEIADWLPTKEQLLWLANTLVEEAKKYAGKLEIQLVRSNFMGILIADMLSKTPEDFKQYLEMLEAQGDCGRKSVSIYPDGSVKPCQFIDWESIGNV
ncbi:MAG TPA: radical SAM protein, partial [Pyrodictium sp.]|nr:radical SAM protein [Pyrodictium sp.]